MGAPGEFQLDADAAARAWLDLHPQDKPLVIAYDVHRCCGGGKICQVRFRELSSKDDPVQFATGRIDEATEVLIDRRAAARLPRRFGLTTHGIGPLKHLDLDLESEDWGTLLYD